MIAKRPDLSHDKKASHAVNSHGRDLIVRGGRLKGGKAQRDGDEDNHFPGCV